MRTWNEDTQLAVISWAAFSSVVLTYFALHPYLFSRLGAWLLSHPKAVPGYVDRLGHWTGSHVGFNEIMLSVILLAVIGVGVLIVKLRPE